MIVVTFTEEVKGRATGYIFSYMYSKRESYLEFEKWCKHNLKKDSYTMSSETFEGHLLTRSPNNVELITKHWINKTRAP